ncbi:putative RDD family membrane protein YckC [Nocardioides ginsengisegetis]|uniref:Putative RDD family membrane protein YckC n=1 Tax=Nocardioides ginsengisegetis TaxID=661491 RepID=A0A7W3J3T9_9ACTN|nr:RDD family protein [Nocardioides ginsengisegetis]MBA8805801.1 putative RDD family membrane protein YckC [Nocardioides ginsengisegetis]
MSDYGTPPQDPTQPNPYGEPPAQTNPYSQQPAYGQPAYGQQPGYGMPAAPAYDYAGWPKRVGAYVIDALILLIAYIPAYVGTAINANSADGATAAGLLLTLVGIMLYIGVFVWNTCMKAGRTGYSIGKGVLGIKLVNEGTGQPIGAGMAFVRQLAHIIDALPCYLGFLWPLWDSKRQTFADKILKTVVVNQPKG